MKLPVLCLFALTLFLGVPSSTEAASLRVNPSTGVYTVGKNFTVSVLINTDGKAVNASDAVLSFNPRELQVVSASRASSIFNLWTEEPTFSNTAGTVSFGGGSPQGYKGGGGVVVTVTFRALGAGTPKVDFKSGSILAADGMGTNILTGMTGGTFTISAPSENPEPEYITPPNTPGTPQVTSSSHPNESKWYKETTLSLLWELPQDVVAVRTLLDTNPGTIPSVVYDERIIEKVIEDLDEGVSYFHIQFRNKEGWGKVRHFRVGVDTTAPTNFVISESADASKTNPIRTLLFTVDDVSPITEYKIQIDGGDPLVFTDTELTKSYSLPSLTPGYHTVVVEAKDSAGNSVIGNYSFTIESFEKPRFIEYPTRINTEVIPAIKGETRPNAKVSIEVKRAQDGMLVSMVSGPQGGDPFTVTANEQGEFVFIPDTSFEQGVYLVTAVARDTFGSVSERSDEIRIIVERPGYITIGSFVISVLSVIMPLIALLFLSAFGFWYLSHRLSSWVKRVKKETREVEDSVTLEFATIVKNLNERVAELRESRKGKLTKAETDLIDQIETDLKHARTRIEKEIGDIESMVK